MKNPYQVVYCQYNTEKAQLLGQLAHKENNHCLRNYSQPKYVFLVHPKSNKVEIARAIEKIYSEKNVTVVSVNTSPIPIKRKKRRKNMREGKTRKGKKAIVTLKEGNFL